MIDTGSFISLLDEQLYCSLSFVLLLQPIQFSVSGADDRPLIALGITSLSIAIDDDTFQVQLVITRNVLFSVVLGIDFLQRHGGIISHHAINTAPVTIPGRTNTIMTIPCTLLCSGNYLNEPSAQNFADHPVHCTPVIINAANDNLPVHFINHSDRDVVVPKHTHVGAMEKVQESD